MFCEPEVNSNVDMRCMSSAIRGPMPLSILFLVTTQRSIIIRCCYLLLSSFFYLFLGYQVHFVTGLFFSCSSIMFVPDCWNGVIASSFRVIYSDSKQFRTWNTQCLTMREYWCQNARELKRGSMTLTGIHFTRDFVLKSYYLRFVGLCSHAL